MILINIVFSYLKKKTPSRTEVNSGLYFVYVNSIIRYLVLRVR